MQIILNWEQSECNNNHLFLIVWLVNIYNNEKLLKIVIKAKL